MTRNTPSGNAFLASQFALLPGPGAWLSAAVTGAILNAAGIVVGSVVGLTRRQPLSPSTQMFLKITLAAATVFYGLRLTWLSLHGTFLQMAKQVLIVLVAMSLGRFTGWLLRLQATSNRLGQYARDRMTQAESPAPRRWSDGFNTCAALFCAAPLAPLGAIVDGLGGYFQPLLIKGVMDGLAAMAFARMFGWSVLASAVPVLVFQGTLSLLTTRLALSLPEAVVSAINATGGLLVFCVALVMLELKKIRLTDYLPSLLFAPVITWLWP